MLKQIKTLIVEDEMIIATNISLQLTSLGYEVSGIVPKGIEVLIQIKKNQPDIIFLGASRSGEQFICFQF